MILGVARWPVLASLVVLGAVATMVALGIWQLGRLGEKEALIARYASASANGAAVAYPAPNQIAAERAFYHTSTIECASTTGQWQSIAGRSARDEAGYVHVIACNLAGGGTANVQAGWSAGPTPPQWEGGPVSGHVAPFGEGFAKLVADPPLAGLAASAKPDPNDLPNNHLAYAGQWFLFAASALVIYVLALRRSQRES